MSVGFFLSDASLSVSPLMCVSASVCEMLSRMWHAKMSGMRTERGLSSEVC